MHHTTDLQTTLWSGGALERPRYYPRQLLTPAEMTLEQTYFRDQLRLHNRLLHGWGVICGAAVCPVTIGNKLEPWKVRVRPGYILGPYGDMIVIDRERTVDLRGDGVSGCAGETNDLADPWCSEVFVERRPSRVYVAVKYKEIMTRPVRVQPGGCGCDDSQCEYSRWRDGYEIGMLDTCPYSLDNPPKLADQLRGPLPECPACPTDPWVVLAAVQLGDDGTVEVIDNCSCRRMVMSVGALWWKCDSGPLAINEIKLSGELIQGVEKIGLVIGGTGFGAQSTVSLGSGVTVQLRQADATSMELEVSVSATATPGPRTLTITNSDCSTAAWREPLTIQARTTTPPPAEDKRPTRRPPSRGPKR